MKEELETLVDNFVTNIFYVWMTSERPNLVEGYEADMKDPERARKARRDWLYSQGEKPRMQDFHTHIWHAINKTIPIQEHVGSVEMKSFWRES